MLMKALIPWMLLAAPVFAQSTRTSDPKDEPALVRALESMAERAANVGASSVVSVFVEREEAAKPATPPRQGRGNNSMRTGGVFEKRPDKCAVSGTIIDPSGLILTSFFNVEGKIKSIRVQLPNGDMLDGELAGYHGPLDVALVRVKATGLSALTPVDPKTLLIGQPVYALGRSPEGNNLTINAGVVSAFGRFNGRILQHDGEINYGNSGGPLVDAQGRLIGISCKIHTKYAGLFGQNSGIGFAAPWDKVTEVLAQLKSGSKVDTEKRAYVGVQSDQGSAAKGAAVAAPQPGTPAEKAGIKSGDVIVEFGGVKLESWDDFTREVARKKPGEKVKLKVKRGDKEVDIELTLGERAVE